MWLKFAIMQNPWCWTPEADQEYTEHLQQAFDKGLTIGLAEGETLGRLNLAAELDVPLTVIRPVLH